MSRINKSVDTVREWFPGAEGRGEWEVALMDLGFLFGW